MVALFINFGYVPRGSPTAKVVAPMALFTLDEEHPLTKAGLRFVHVVERVEAPAGVLRPTPRQARRNAKGARGIAGQGGDAGGAGGDEQQACDLDADGARTRERRPASAGVFAIHFDARFDQTRTCCG